MTRLLVAYDGSVAARAAVDAAGALFAGAEAIVAAVHTPEPAPLATPVPSALLLERVAELDAELEVQAHELAAEGAQRASAAGLEAAPRVLEGASPWRALRALACDEQLDLLACGTRGHGPVERVLLGSTASSLLYHAGCPLLVVPAGTVRLTGPLLAGYDGSEGARRVLRFAADHLRARPLVVAHAWRSPVRHTLRGHALLDSRVDTLSDYAETLDTVWREIAEEAAQEGAAAARALGLEATASAPESGQGDWHALLHGAREAGAAALLVGPRGRGAAASAMLGSVASGLVHAAALPVLVVGP